MSNEMEVYQEVDEFVKKWQEKEPAGKASFSLLLEVIKDLDGIACTFSARPGISYSLRPGVIRQSDRAFFMVLDVIDDDPEERWLSVCFYADLITDPEGRGDLVPGGLAGGDGYCFDVIAYDENMLRYLAERCREAHITALSRA